RRDPGLRRLRGRARPAGDPAPAGGRVLRRGDGQRRGRCPAPQPVGTAAAAVGAAGQRGGDRTPVGLKLRRFGWPPPQPSPASGGGRRRSGMPLPCAPFSLTTLSCLLLAAWPSC